MKTGSKQAAAQETPHKPPLHRRPARMYAAPPLRPLTVAGIMSGTSADGIDVAIVRLRPRASSTYLQQDTETGLDIKLELLHHSAARFPKALRDAVLAAMGTAATSAQELARLNWRLGLAYAEAAQGALARWSLTEPRPRIDLIGCHGQTVYHQGLATRWIGRKFACTWQIGEPSMLAHALGVPVVSNFRPADMARGGQGAPLVPLLDYALYRHPRRARVLQNIGGIGNLTLVPAGAPLSIVSAFDTGPGNMIVDWLMQQLYGRPFDRAGQIAQSGTVLIPVIETALCAPFFRKPPPKSAGREQFGSEYGANLLAQCRLLSSKPQDSVATATALTAYSIALAYKRYVRAVVTHTRVDYIVSGGGAKNTTLMRMLREQLEPFGCKVATTGASSMPVEAKEAAAFALLAYQTWHHRPGNVPSATGAQEPAILGQLCYA